MSAEQWWAGTFPNTPIGYDAVLEACTLTATERRRFLEPFFVPTDEEREAGTKMPASAHKAIARLVKRHSIRVIVTTNFDDLIEKALDAEGVPYQIISSSRDLHGAEPLRHGSCTIIKVHGDYRQTDQLNTKAELASYQQEINDLLTEVFDEYGLITCGWSADWDTALVSAVTRATSRRYPMYWASRGELGANAQQLVQHRRGTIVQIDDADAFFVNLADRLDVLDRMTNPPLTRDLAIGQLKRYLPNPTRRIDLRDLLEGEIQRVRSTLDTRSLSKGSDQPAEVDGVNVFKSEADRLTDITSTLMYLIANGITLDTARDHDDLWIWIIEQLMRACRHTPKPDDPNQTVNDTWKNLGYLPAWLALRTASYAAIHAKRDDLLIRLHLEPNCYDQSVYDENGRPLPEAPAVAVLYEYRILADALQLILPNKKDFAREFLFSDQKLRPIFEPLLGNQAAYTLLADRNEYRSALIQLQRGRPNCWAPVLSRTHYDGSDNFREGTWRFTTDFTTTADTATWLENFALSQSEFESLQTSLEEIAYSRKWY